MYIRIGVADFRRDGAYNKHDHSTSLSEFTHNLYAFSDRVAELRRDGMAQCSLVGCDSSEEEEEEEEEEDVSCICVCKCICVTHVCMCMCVTHVCVCVTCDGVVVGVVVCLAVPQLFRPV
jgi:hypothetical protein